VGEREGDEGMKWIEEMREGEEGMKWIKERKERYKGLRFERTDFLLGTKTVSKLKCEVFQHITTCRTGTFPDNTATQFSAHSVAAF
jgi:hypothetical protein